MSKLMKMLKPLMTKKILVMMLSVLLVASLAAVITVIATEYPALTVSSHTIDYDADSAARQLTVTVSLPADTSYKIAGASFNIGFDPTLMTCNLNAQSKPDVTWNVADGYKAAALNPVNEHLTNLTFVWANEYDISYTTTTDVTVKFVTVKFTVAPSAPAKEYPIALSFPNGTYVGNMINAALQNVATDLVGGKLTINPIPIFYTATITGLINASGEYAGEAYYGTTLGASAVSIVDDRNNDIMYTGAEVDYFTY